MTSNKEVQEKQLTKQEMESELFKLHTLILSRKNQDSLDNPNFKLKK
jgi:hypothetical protein